MPLDYFTGKTVHEMRCDRAILVTTALYNRLEIHPSSRKNTGSHIATC